MDIAKLRIFATVARLGNFTRAAELLYLTQPTVSQQIAALEAQLGAPLIERRQRRLRVPPPAWPIARCAWGQATHWPPICCRNCSAATASCTHSALRASAW